MNVKYFLIFFRTVAPQLLKPVSKILTYHPKSFGTVGACKPNSLLVILLGISDFINNIHYKNHILLILCGIDMHDYLFL